MCQNLYITYDCSKYSALNNTLIPLSSSSYSSSPCSLSSSSSSLVLLTLSHFHDYDVAVLRQLFPFLAFTYFVSVHHLLCQISVYTILTILSCFSPYYTIELQLSFLDLQASFILIAGPYQSKFSAVDYLIHWLILSCLLILLFKYYGHSTYPTMN